MYKAIEAVEVTQADRDAAAALVQTPYLVSWITRRSVDPIKSGALDHISMVQAFARHRLSTLKEEGMGWQPIETAKLGSVVIIYDPIWGVTEGLLFDDGTWGLASFNGQVIKAEPTLWRLLPAPPASSLNASTDDASRLTLKGEGEE